MAIQKQTISLNLGLGIDQKDDPRISPPDAYNAMSDWRRDKLKRLAKRFGTDALPTTVQTSFPNPLSIGSTDIPSSVFSHEDQLMMQNKGALYSFDEDNDLWKFVSHYYPLQAKSSVVISNEAFAYGPDVGIVNGKTVYAYLKRDPISSTTDYASVRVTVIDENGHPLNVDAFVEANFVSPSSSTMSPPKVVTFQNTCFVIFINGTNLRSVQVNTTTGALGSITTFESGAFQGIWTAGEDEVFSLDYAYANKSGVGERAFIIFKTTTPGTVKMTPMLNTGSADVTMGSVTFTDVRAGMGIYYSTTNDKIYLGYMKANSGDPVYQRFSPYYRTYTFTSSSITSSSGEIDVGAGLLYPVSARSFCFMENPITPTQVQFFFDPLLKTTMNSKEVWLPELQRALISNNTWTGTAVIGRGLVISAKPIKDTERMTIYLPMENPQNIDGSVMLADILKGKSESIFSQVKINEGESTILNTPLFMNAPYLPAVISPASRQWVIPGMVKTRVGSSGNPIVSGSANIYLTGISAVTLNFAPVFSPSNAYINRGTHLTGGYLGYYDGYRFGEHGFFIPPEDIEVTGGQGAARAVFTVTQQGDASNPEISTIQFFSGSSISPGKYFTFNSVSVNYYGWFRVNGAGSDPAIPGATGITIDIIGNEPAVEIARITSIYLAAAMPPFGAGRVNVLQIPSTSIVRLTNNTNGAVTDGSAAGMNGSSAGLSAGTYQWVAVWSYIDANGNNFRSQTSVPVSLVVSSGPAFLTVVAPPVSNREVSLTGVEIYRTIAGGATFHRITPLPLQYRWNINRITVSFSDDTSDAVANAGELLYTTGGVQPNMGIGACDAISICNDRIIVSNSDSNEVPYSKTAVQGNPVEFSATLYIATTQDRAEIRGHHKMDDKLVIFKDTKILYYAGDGANDLGNNSTFSLPVDIATDVGCENQNSIEIAPEGLYFKSKMGISLVNRSAQVMYSGIYVKDYNDIPVERARLLTEDSEVREIRFVLNNGVTLVYDYLSKLWGTFSNYSGKDACLWKGLFARVSSAGVVSVENQSSWKDVGSASPTYTPTIRTTWLKLKGIQDFQRVSRLMVLGELKTPSTLNYKVWYDYDLTNFDTYSFNSDRLTGTGPDALVFEPEIHLKRQKCEAIMVELTVVPNVTSPTNSEESLNLADMSFYVGIKAGLNKVEATKKL